LTNRVVTTFLLLRHGETLWNREGRLQGWRDSRLSAAGLAQVEALATRVSAEQIDLVVASDLGRARATAVPIAARLGVQLVLDTGLRERCYGLLEGMTWSEVEQAYPEIYRRLAVRDVDYVVPGGESAAQFRARIVDTVQRLAREYSGASIAIVTHGGVLGVIYRHAHDIALDVPRTFGVPNAAVNRLSVGETGWKVDAWGDVGHLSGAVLDDE
jgi:2,3-bisphosphoglycerate-dependent phosphoglycerate mutase